MRVLYSFKLFNKARLTPSSGALHKFIHIKKSRNETKCVFLFLLECFSFSLLCFQSLFDCCSVLTVRVNRSCKEISLRREGKKPLHVCVEWRENDEKMTRDVQMHSMRPTFYSKYTTNTSIKACASNEIEFDSNM